MIDKDFVVEFCKENFNDDYTEERIRETPIMFLVNPQPTKYFETNDYRDMMIGSGPYVILKETGEVTNYGSNPIWFPLYDAQTMEEYESAKKAVFDRLEKNHSGQEDN
ncbi:MAG: hypothetical protein U0R17_02240 [Acidimicrobiia bacterium]